MDVNTMPLPNCPAELEVLTLAYFGKKLHLESLHVWGDTAQYRVLEEYNSYHGKGFKFPTHCIHGYDHSSDFWCRVIGKLSCGGIATYSHGQAKIVGERQRKRLLHLQDCLRRNDPGRIRKAFERLASKQGAGEKTAIPDDRLLTTGREDGAEAVSIGGGP